MSTLREHDLITVLSEDHRAVEQAFEQLQDRQGSSTQRSTLARDVAAALRRHAEAEERHLYPLVRRELPDGAARADRELSEHAEAERVMADLAQVGSGDERFETLVAELVGLVRNHVQEEEHELFPRLVQAVPAGTLRELGTYARQVTDSDLTPSPGRRGPV
ncbi:MAG: hemerythrin domain-containing protein [Pseudonocardiaceae bacterium]|nr:hemerythrin domain-containing protein [Pseudonocardiaceae bacterium]